jgi:hypothetical protein
LVLLWIEEERIVPHLDPAILPHLRMDDMALGLLVQLKHILERSERAQVIMEQEQEQGLLVEQEHKARERQWDYRAVTYFYKQIHLT